MPDPEVQPSTTTDAATTPDETQAEPTPEVQYVQLRRNALYQDLAQLEASDPEVRQVIGTYVGNKVSRQYQPQLRAKDAEIAQLRTDLFRAEIKSMDDAAIEAKVSSDREWGKRYIDFVHEEKAGRPQPTAVDERPAVAQALNEVEDYARRNGVSDQDWQGFMSKASSGHYGADVHWTVGIMRMQEDIANHIHKPAPAPEVQKTNPSLTAPGPVSTNGTRTGGGRAAFPANAKEFNALPIAEQRALLDADFAKVRALTR